MTNMSLKKNEMPLRAPKERRETFDEVALGYTEGLALDEAARCLHCRNKPCVGGCPVAIDIPQQQPAGRLRACLPAGKPVRKVLRARHQRRTCRYRPP